jgi:hypothetical protein
MGPDWQEGGRSVSGAVQRSGRPQGHKYNFSLAGQPVTRLGVTDAVDWPLRASESRVAAVGRSKILQQRIKAKRQRPINGDTKPN